MSFNPAPNHERCTATREYVGPFPVVTTRHHPTCTDRTDKEMRTR
jgi:hypothetical protein